MRRTFFVVNFAVASLLALASAAGTVVGVRVPEWSAIAVLCGLSAVLAFSWWAVSEWQGYVGDRPDQERQAGLCAAFLGAFLLFAVSTTVLDGNAKGVAPRVFWTANAALAATGAWFVACGFARKRRTDSIE